MRGCRRCPASHARKHSPSKGHSSVSKAYFRIADCCAAWPGRRQRRYAARGAGLGLSHQPDSDRAARDAARQPMPLSRSPRRPDGRRSAPRSASTAISPAAAFSTPAATGTPTCLGRRRSQLPFVQRRRVKNSVRAAKTRVEAGRATLRAVEGDVFTQAVSAYMDVIRDRAIVELNENNVKVLETNLEATQRPVPDRRPDPHRRRPVRSAASARPFAARRLAQGRLTGKRSDISPGHRPCAGNAGAAAAAAAASRRPPTKRCGSRLANNPDLIAISRQAIAAGYDVNVARRAACRQSPASLSGTYVEQHRRHQIARQCRPPGTRPRSALSAQHPDLPGRPAGGAHPPGAGSSRGRCWSRSSAPSARSFRLPARPSRPTTRRRRRSSPRPSRSRPTSSRSKAPAPSKASAPAPSSTSSTPSRNC